jgi:two-component system, OmpR family, KDP operon response regulator KdpE
MSTTQPDAVRVLIVGDEPALLGALRTGLAGRGYQVSASSAGQAALAEAAQRPPDAVLLDLGLADLDGLEVIHQWRTWSTVPIVVVSAWAGTADKVDALNAGADDYLTKPFSMDELLARLHAVLRRDARRPADTAIRVGRCQIDLAGRTVTRPSAAGPQPVHLTRTEWQILAILLHSPGRLVTSARLLAAIWGPGRENSTHYLRFHMAGLRRKLEDDPPRPRHLLTEPGMGYRYQP